MAIKIITFHRALNYGAVLQCYALYKVLKEIYDDVYVYDHVPEKMREQYKILKFSNNIKNNTFQLLALPIKLKKANGFDRFIKTHLELTDTATEQDVFVVGSDQVWNHNASDFDKTYLLDFVKEDSHKFSYAASFGVSIIEEEYIPEYRRLLNKFNKITVRENTGKNLIRSICGKECDIMPDPVFLLDKENWHELIKNYNDKYILLYAMTKTKTIVDFAKDLSNKTGLPVYFIDNYEYKLRKEFKIIRGADPIQWLSLVANAEYIITNSFHGTAFSILFNKKFYTELLPDGFKVNSRLEDLLTEYGLENRIIHGTRDDMFVEPDYTLVNKTIEEKRNAAKQYLMGIGGAFNENNRSEK